MVVVPKTGLEPVSLSAADFKSDVYTIPPLGPTATNLRVKVMLATRETQAPALSSKGWQSL